MKNSQERDQVGTNVMQISHDVFVHPDARRLP